MAIDCSTDKLSDVMLNLQFMKEKSSQSSLHRTVENLNKANSLICSCFSWYKLHARELLENREQIADKFSATSR